MEKDNVNIVNNSSLLSTEILDNTIHQEQEPEQPVHQIRLVNIPLNLEEELVELIILPEHAYSPLPQ
jgi:hypothetical protein